MISSLFSAYNYKGKQYSIPFLMGRKQFLKSVMLQFVAVLLGLIVIFPVLYALSTSFMKSTDILSMNPRIIPRSIHFFNYKEVMETTMMLRFIWNSVFITTITSSLRIIVAALAAYAYACFEFSEKKLFFYSTIGTMLIPGEATLLTNYETISKPILVTAFITGFVEIWNVYLWPMLITNRNEMRTVQVGIAQLNSTEGFSYKIKV